MALKIRLRQQGRKNHLTYRLVVADSRSPRDGKYVEMVGHYDPHVEGDKNISVYEERLSYWIDKGAEFTEKARSLVARVSPEIMKNDRERRREKQVKLNKKRREAKKK